MSHPSQTALRERLVADYTAGALPAALAMLVETQAALSPETASEIAVADVFAGAVFEAEAPVPLAADALAAVLARIAAEPAAAAPPQIKRGGEHFDDLAALPSPVRDLALDALARKGWRFAAPGIRSLQLEMGGDAKAEILRIEPGAAAPTHTHEGEEFTLVLRGAFHDVRGVYRAGDIAHADPSVTHRPTGEAGDICYSLAVTDAPLAFKGALGVLQRLWKH